MRGVSAATAKVTGPLSRELHDLDKVVSALTDDELAAADPAKHPTVQVIEATFERGEKLNARLNTALRGELDEAQRSIVWPKGP